MVTVRSRARARNRARPTLAWLIAAIVAALLALSVRIAAAEPISADTVIGDIDEIDELDDLGEGELGDREIDELIAEAVDELTDDQLEELGFDDEVIDGRWIAEAPTEVARRRSPIGRVDLSIAYRRIDPLASAARDELVVLGTWRR